MKAALPMDYFYMSTIAGLGGVCRGTSKTPSDHIHHDRWSVQRYFGTLRVAYYTVATVPHDRW